MGERQIEKLTAENGKTYPVKLNTATGGFSVKVDGKFFEGRNLKLLKERAARYMASVAGVRWTPVITIAFASLKDRIQRDNLGYDYGRWYRGELADESIVERWWGNNGKPEGDPRPRRDEWCEDFVTIPYSEKVWDALKRLDLSVVAAAKAIRAALREGKLGVRILIDVNPEKTGGQA